MSNYIIYNEGDNDADWQWRLADNNGESIMIGQESIPKGKIKMYLKEIKQNAPMAEIVDTKGLSKTSSVLRIIAVKVDDKFCWKLERSKGDIVIATSFHKFNDEKDVLASMGKAKSNFGGEIIWDNPEEDPSNKPNEDDTTPTKGIPGS